MLACPHCGGDLAETDGAVRCESGHSYDVARQGYVNLLGSEVPPGHGDTAEMVAARVRFLDAGHFDPLLDAVAARAASVLEGTGAGGVVDVGGGTGHLLARVLEAAPGRAGVCLDLSAYAARRAARAHPRAGAAVCDAWGGLPLRKGSAALVLSAFAPRNGPQMRRALAAGGEVLVVAPEPGHLAELAEPLGLIGIDEDKRARVDAALAPLQRAGAEPLEFPLELRRDDVAALVAMGPSARHVEPDALAEAIAGLPEPVAATASVSLAVYRPPGG
jgi:23S rRNA (guanine745-N1)-methyltransferase